MVQSQDPFVPLPELDSSRIIRRLLPRSGRDAGRRRVMAPSWRMQVASRSWGRSSTITSVRDDIWDPPRLVTYPAIVTEVFEPKHGELGPSLRVTAFRPYDKPAWDITAAYSAEPQSGCWTWPDADGIV
jgi:hypothetical protein